MYWLWRMRTINYVCKSFSGFYEIVLSKLSLQKSKNSSSSYVQWMTVMWFTVAWHARKATKKGGCHCEYNVRSCYLSVFFFFFVFLSHCNMFSVCYIIISVFGLIMQKQIVNVGTVHVMQFVSVCFRCPSLCTGHLAAWLIEVGRVL